MGYGSTTSDLTGSLAFSSRGPAAVFWAETTSAHLFNQVHSGCYIENILEGGKGRIREACDGADGDSEQGRSSNGSEKGLKFW